MYFIICIPKYLIYFITIKILLYKTNKLINGNIQSRNSFAYSFAVCAKRILQFVSYFSFICLYLLFCPLFYFLMVLNPTITHYWWKSDFVGIFVSYFTHKFLLSGDFANCTSFLQWFVMSALLYIIFIHVWIWFLFQNSVSSIYLFLAVCDNCFWVPA
jgi:hypothetical protein